MAATTKRLICICCFSPDLAWGTVVWLFDRLNDGGVRNFIENCLLTVESDWIKPAENESDLDTEQRMKRGKGKIIYLFSLFLILISMDGFVCRLLTSFQCSTKIGLKANMLTKTKAFSKWFTQSEHFDFVEISIFLPGIKYGVVFNTDDFVFKYVSLDYSLDVIQVSYIFGKIIQIPIHCRQPFWYNFIHN